MADVTNSRVFDAAAGAIYVPFRGASRYVGAIGTLSVNVQVTGDAGGGTANLQFTALSDMFGFHGLYVPRMINTSDNLAVAESVKLSFNAAGNERVVNDFELAERVQKTVASEQFTSWSVDDFSLVIEPNQLTATNVISLQWATNVDTKVYKARLFCLVYDLEARSKIGGWVTDPGMLNS